MKHTFLKKAIFSAGAAICVFSLGISAFAAESQRSKNNSTVMSASANITDPVLYEADGYSVLYQDEFFSLGVGQTEIIESNALDEVGEPVLVSRNEYVEGDYRYVDEIYCQPLNSPLRSLKTVNWWGTHEVYYESELADGLSMHPGTMRIEGTFYLDEDQNVAYVDDKSVKCTTTKSNSGKYPIILEGDPECNSDISIGSKSPRFATISCSVVFVKAAGVRDTHNMVLAVSSNNKAEVKCNHYAG